MFLRLFEGLGCIPMVITGANHLSRRIDQNLYCQNIYSFWYRSTINTPSDLHLHFVPHSPSPVVGCTITFAGYKILLVVFFWGIGIQNSNTMLAPLKRILSTSRPKTNRLVSTSFVRLFSVGHHHKDIVHPAIAVQGQSQEEAFRNYQTRYRRSLDVSGSLSLFIVSCSLLTSCFTLT